MDRTGGRDPAEERTAADRVETGAGKTLRVPEPGAEIVRVLPADEPAVLGPDHVAG